MSPELLINQLQIVSSKDPCLGLGVIQNQKDLLMFTIEPKDVVKNIDEQPNEEIHRARSVRVLRVLRVGVP